MRRLYDDDAAAALCSDALVPPTRSTNFADGTTAELRDAMARFSAGDEHAARRAAVVAAVESVDAATVRSEVHELTLAIVSSSRAVEAIADVGFVVPTRALLAALGVSPADLAERADDVVAVVSVVGRGEPSSARSDAAAHRLFAEFDRHPSGAVSAISVLYQNHDATAALFSSVVLSRATGDARQNALVKTVRTATTDITVGNEHLDDGEIVEVSLEADGHEFGLGSHACPAETLATIIVDAMSGALDVAGCTVDLDAATFGADGRPITLPLRT